MLEAARTQWQFGDWASLAQIDNETLNRHPHRAELALLSAAGHLQQGNPQAARACIQLARIAGCPPRLMSQVLIAGVYNSLGRAAAIGGQEAKALQHFEQATQLPALHGDAALTHQARASEQFTQLGLPYLWKTKTFSERAFYTEMLLEQAIQQAPTAPALLMALAETEQRRGKYEEAVRYWQKLAAVDGQKMPQAFYDRLDQAYSQLKSFPPGSPDVERLQGDGDKHEILGKTHALLQPRSYLEIGVQTGKSLALASCPAIGVDPMPQIKSKLGANAKIIRATSDDFFAGEAKSLITEPLELVFIDGMHLFEYVLRDFMNVERYSSPHTLVVIDDIYPGHPAQADRNRRTRAWTGDVWKLLVTLQRFRPDLVFLTLDAYPTGLLFITGLDEQSTVLQNSYEEILNIFKKLASPPEDILKRKSAFSCKSGELEGFINNLNSRKQGVTTRFDR